MPTVRHPRALDAVDGHPPSAVTVNGDTYAVDRDADPATVALPDERAVATLADAYGLESDALAVGETCEVVKADGDVCGRDLPCPYHSDD